MNRHPAPYEPPRPRVEFDAPLTGEHSGGAHACDPRGVDPHWRELSALVTRAERNRAQMARLQAERAEMCAEALQLVAMRVAQRRAARPSAAEYGDTIPLREVMAELATALRVGERTISTWLGDGAALVGTYRATLDALRCGRIDERHAAAIVDAGGALDPERRAEYEALILPLAERETAPAVRAQARVIAARLQPDIVERSRRDALDARRVRSFALGDGLSRLLLDGPATLIAGVFERVTDIASSLGDGDGAGAEADAAVAAPVDPDAAAATEAEADDRTLDQRRADVAMDLLLTGAPSAHSATGLGAIRATVRVTVPILTLAGRGDEPAILDGHGPIDVDTARVLAASAPCWERVMTHPVTEEPLRLDVYRPGARLRRLLDARDQHCRWPGCRRAAHRGEADHTVAFADGGRTSAANLAILCTAHHRLKHASPWGVRQLGGGSLEFTSPTGRTHRTDPPVTALARAAPAAKPWMSVAYDAGPPPPF